LLILLAFIFLQKKIKTLLSKLPFLRTLFTLLLLFTLATSCREIKPPVSELDEQKLVGVLKDLMLVQAGNNAQNFPAGQRDTLQRMYRQRVFERYQTDSGQVCRSVEAYHTHINHMDTLHAMVLAAVNAELAAYDIDQAKDKARNDQQLDQHRDQPAVPMPPKP